MSQKIPLILLLFICSYSLTAQISELPENAQAGKCYKKCFKPPKYETVFEEVITKEAYTKIMVEPAEYDTIYREIVEREGYKVFNVIPSEFTTAEVQVVIEPEHTEYTFVPPVFEQQPEFILLEPSHLKWKRSISNTSCITNESFDDCAIWCWEVIPARVDTVFQQVVKVHPRPIEVEIPAVIKHFEKAIVLSPASIETKIVPPKNRIVAALKLVKPARIVEVEVPAESSMVSIQKMVEEGSLEKWVEVDCNSITYIE